MKKYLFLVVVSLICFTSFSQPLVDSTASYIRRDMYEKVPVELPKIREADVMWKRTIWRIIDLREKINQVLYFPVEKYGNRINLIQLLLESIEKGLITPYLAPSGNGYEFQEKIDFAEVKRKMGGESKTITVTDPVTGEESTKTVEGVMQYDKIRQYQLKEEWVFDKSMSTFKKNIIGIAPIREYFQNENDEEIEDNVKRERVFWLYFPEIRKVLANREIINFKNEAESLTFDEFFRLRKFNSYIVRTAQKEKQINEYTVGIESQIEADRIEAELFDFEHDLWEW